MTDWAAVERNVRRAIAYLQLDMATRHQLDFRPDPADLVIPGQTNLTESDAGAANSSPEAATTVS